jgi:bacterioferritin-associated ferredoxin
MKKTHPFERSDDVHKAARPHIAKALGALAEMRARGTTCERCRKRRATALVDELRRHLCTGCADAWRALSPLDRRRVQMDEWTRGRK